MNDSNNANNELVAEVVELRRRITELETQHREHEASESELKTARDRFEYLLAFSPAIIYTTQSSGGFACTYVTENIRSIMGFAPQDMTTDAKCWPDKLHPDDAERVLSELGPLIEQGGGTVEYRFQHRDGHYVWIQDTFKVVYEDSKLDSSDWPKNFGPPLELVGAWADITKRKEAEQAALIANAELQETKRSLSRLIESSPDAIISTDKVGHIVMFNEGAETLLGYRAGEIVGQNVARIYGGEAGANEVLREMRKRGGTVSGFDSVLWAKDETAIPVLISASLLFDEDGHQIGTVGFATDLRERKRSQEELQRAYDELEKRVEERTVELNEARGRLQYLLTVTPGIMYTNLPTDGYRCSFVSRNVDPIMGFSEWEMLEDPEFWPKRLHPEDTNRVFEEMGPLVEAGGGTIEYRFRHRDGNYVWIQDTFKVVHDAAGKPLEIVGSWADITHRKQVEHALGERMALMNDLQSLVAASPAVIYTTRASGDFACTFVSENLKTTMGYAPWEMREDSKFWLKRLHPEDAPRVFEDLSKLIERGGGTIEYRFRHRRGHYIWIQDTFTATKDKDGNPKELIGSWADISDRKKIEAEMTRLAEEVEVRNRFIRDTFGRYLTDEVVSTLLDSPSGLEMVGEKRKITMLMADLRGFTSLSERMDPKWVVSILNRYLSTMVAIVKKYGGTIDEFIGDAVFVLFGAPTWHDDDAQRAVACAVEMQLAMGAVNEQNRTDGLPDVEMGIGLHTGQVIVGNIGSSERLKYGVVGSHVNLTSRIQSFTVGGQVLASESTRREVGTMLKIGKQMEVRAKGFEQHITLCEVLGIGGPHKLMLYQSAETLTEIADLISLTCSVLEGDFQGEETFKGSFTKLSAKQAEARLEKSVPVLSNLKLRLIDEDDHELAGALYGKVVSTGAGGKSEVLIHFTSMSREIETFLGNQRRKFVGDGQSPPASLPTTELPSKRATLH
jgi:PAS domain S-box-containing protein